MKMTSYLCFNKYFFKVFFNTFVKHFRKILKKKNYKNLKATKFELVDTSVKKNLLCNNFKSYKNI